MNKIVSFQGSSSPDKPEHWKTRFNRLHETGRFTLLGFPFTCIENKQALLDLYEAVPELLKDYPGVVDKFFENADIAMDVAEQSIEEERRRREEKEKEKDEAASVKTLPPPPPEEPPDASDDAAPGGKA